MISATRLLSHPAKRWRLSSSGRRLASASPSAAAPAAPASEFSRDRTYSLASAVGGAAGLTALGLGWASDTRTGCEPSAEIPLWQTVRDEEGEGKGKTLLRTIAPGDCHPGGDDGDGGKSLSAFASATEHGLFNGDEDGADDWEEVDGDDGGEAAPAATAHAVAGRFASFSPGATPSNLQPRRSIRPTHRGAEQEDGAERRARPLATAAAVAAAQEDRRDLAKRITAVRHNTHGRNQVYTKNMYFYQSTKVKDFCTRKLRVFALPSSATLGLEVAYLLGTELHSIDVGAFADGETSVRINNEVRGKEVFVLCATTSTDAIMELLLAVSALRRGSAKRICAVIPYYGYARQDRRTRKGMGLSRQEPISAADVAIMLEEVGVNSVIAVDLHNPLLKGFFSPHVPVDHLMPGPVAAAYFYEELYGKGGGDGDETEEAGGGPKENPKITIVAAHENCVFRASGFRNALQKLSGDDDIKVALINTTKALNVKEDSESATLVGNVQGRKCIIVDDIINTGGTLMHAIEEVNKSGASEVYAWATHGAFHRPDNTAPEKIQETDGLQYVLISNSVGIGRELPPKIRKLSIAPLLAEAVARALNCESISALMNVKAQESDK